MTSYVLQTEKGYVIISILYVTVKKGFGENEIK